MKQLRELSCETVIRSEHVDKEARTVSVSFSSEEPIRDYWGLPPVVLLHERKAFSVSRFREMGAVLLNHDPDQIVGKPIDVDLDVDERKGRATIHFDSDEESERIFQKVVGGSLRGISVRYAPREHVRLEEKDTWNSPEGRKFKGPLVVVSQWEPREISLTPIPADLGVGVGRHDAMATTAEDSDMEWLKKLLLERGLIREDSTDEDVQRAVEAYFAERREEPARQDPEGPAPVPAKDPEPPPEPSAREEQVALKAERERVKRLNEIAKTARMPEKAGEWIERGLSPDEAGQEALKEMEARSPDLHSVSVERDARDKRRDAWGQVLLRRCVPYVPSTRAREVLGVTDRDVGIPEDMPFAEIVRRILEEEGVREARHLGREQLWARLESACRGFPMGTSDLPYLLENTAQKSLAAAFEEAPATFTIWCGSLEVPDFKSASRVKLSELGNFDLTPEHMPIPESYVSDARETFQVYTYSRRFGISRQAFVNDDMGGITRIPALCGQAAKRTMNVLIYTAFQANGTMAEDSTACFATTHPSGSNLGTAGAPSDTTLNEALKLMRLQKGFGEDTAALNVVPTYIIVPAAHEATVRKILYGQLYPTASSSVVPDWQRGLTLIVEPLLDSTSATAWYMAASAASIDTVSAVYLRGQRTPTVQRFEGTSVLGVEWVAYFDFGAKVLEHRGLFKNAGA